jgi:ketosteroid isomerase-like protein
MRIRIRFVLLLILTVATTSCRRPIPPAADRDAIAQTVNTFHEALERGDQSAVLSLLAPDAQILESGVRQTVEEYTREHLGSDIGFAKSVKSTRSGIIVRQEGAVAWTTETSRSTGRFLGRDVDNEGTELMVLAKSDDGWRIRAIHWSIHSHSGAAGH